MKKITGIIFVVLVLGAIMPAMAVEVNAEYASHTENITPSAGTIADAVASPDDGFFVQLDVNSTITLCFPGDYVAAKDGTDANDLRIDIFDTAFPADANILVSADGLSWISLGIHPDTNNINVDLDAEGIDVVKCVMIDQGLHFIDSNFPDMGFDLDAVVALNAVQLASIEKEFDRSDANLGDHVMVIIEVNNPHDSNVFVVDVLDAGLSYIPTTLTVDAFPVVPVIIGDSIIIEVESGVHEIIFDVQVTGVEADESLAENCATVVHPR